jgi:hypothetical protein
MGRPTMELTDSRCGPLLGLNDFWKEVTCQSLLHVLGSRRSSMMMPALQGVILSRSDFTGPQIARCTMNILIYVPRTDSLQSSW